jgi:phage repressor protein C with HTH and peptisase S24 domain
VATDSEGADILILRVKGDSMAPTYTPIDRVMVDTRDTVPSPPGIFVVWDTRSYLVARLQLVPRSTPPRVKISFDNGKYDGYEEVLEGELIKGRVIGKWQWS